MENIQAYTDFSDPEIISIDNLIEYNDDILLKINS